ncbi:hypothetical protein LCGC14_1784860, partial [marine sediment metagenome]
KGRAKADPPEFRAEPYVGMLLRTAANRVFFLAVNPEGTVWHARRKGVGSWDRAWNPGTFKAVTRRAYGYWITEMKIALSDLGMEKGARPRGWSGNFVCRKLTGSAPKGSREVWTYSHLAWVPGVEWTGKELRVGPVAPLRFDGEAKAPQPGPGPAQAQPAPWSGCEFTAAELQAVYPEGPVLLVPQVTDGPKIDGDPKDPAWQRVPAVQLEYLDADVPGKPNRNRTWMRILTDARYLYVLFDCEESNIKDLVIGSDVLWKDDCADLFLDVGRHQDIGDRGYHIIETNPKGRYLASTWVREEWHPKSLKIGTKIYEDRWVAEIRVSFEDLGIDPKMFPKVWGANLFRVRCSERGRFKGNWFNPLRSNNEFAWRGNFIRNGHHPSMYGVLYFQVGNALPSELMARLREKRRSTEKLTLKTYQPPRPSPRPAADVSKKDAVFVRKPTVTVKGEEARIALEVSKPTDVAVGIRDGKGRIVRHLASGQLGPRAPGPLRRGSLKQELKWDFTDDFGKSVPPGDYSVEIGLGLKAEKSKVLLGDPHKLYDVQGLTTDSKGLLYVFHQRRRPYPISVVRVFDREGRFVRQIMPLPAHLPADKLEGAGVIRLAEGRWMPVVYEGLQRAFVPGTINFGAQQPSMTRDGRLVLINSVTRIYQEVPQRLFFFGADGSVAKNFAGPVISRLPRFGTMATALSPDGKFVYVTGLENKTRGILWHAPFKAARRPLHVVYRIGLDGAADELPRKPFLGRYEIDGKDERHLSDPGGLAVDSKGRIYVADTGNGRVAVFSPDGEFLKAAKLDTPMLVKVHPKSGAIYVLCGKGEAYRLVKLRSFEDPSPVAEVTVTRGKNRRDRGHPTLLALDASATQPLLWVAAGRESVRQIVDRGETLQDRGDPIRRRFEKRGGSDIPNSFRTFEISHT